MTDVETGPGDRVRDHGWSLAVAIILSLATLSTAWCSFQASTWGAEFSTESRTGTAARIEASRQADVADRQMSSDLQIFGLWLESEVQGDGALADAVEARFRPHFVDAFEVWSRQAPGPDGLPPGAPFDLAEYVLPTLEASDAAYARATEAVVRADEAGAVSNRYVLTTVLYASVLFLAGIASKLTHPTISHAVVTLAGAALAGATVLLVTLPVHVT